MARAGWSTGALIFATACYSGLPERGEGGAEGADESASEGGSEEGGEPACGEPGAVLPGRAPLRRLTRFEYNNTVRDLFGDDTLPANAFPSEEIGNGFGNDADAQAVSSLLAEKYSAVAEDVATRATETPAKLAQLDACAATVTDATAEACARAIIEHVATKAFRRPLVDGELDELVELFRVVAPDTTFAVAVAAVIEAILQSPDFLYKLELGEPDGDGHLRPTGHEMATRLSYFLWGSLPDDALLAAAASGELASKDGVLAQAERMLDDERARPVVRHFFDNLLPISALSQLERDELRYPAYDAAIGALMREETQAFVADLVFERGGSWSEALTAEYSFMNERLAAYYGIAGVVGEELREVPLDTTQRLGLLTQAGVVAGTIHSNETNPVVRGSFIVQKMMCRTIPLPSGEIAAEIRPPDPDSGATARERYEQHSSDPACTPCHQQMDPVGLAFENYDAIGQWRDTENGVTIDASGSIFGTDASYDGPIALVRGIAESPETHACFAKQWASFAYGRTLGADDTCVSETLEDEFIASGADIRGLLLALTQTDAFLYLPEGEQ